MSTRHVKTPVIVVALASAAWLTASWTRWSVGQGIRLGFALAACALVALLFLAPRNSERLHVPKPAVLHLVGIALMVAGLFGGAVLSGVEGRQLVTILGYGVMASLPLVLLLRMNADSERIRRLAQWFVIGVAASVLAAPLFGQIAHIGRWTGGGGHMNQLAATCAMGLPLIRLCFRGRRFRVPARIALWTILLLGLQQSGSRSGLIGAVIVVLLLLVNWVRRDPRRALVGLAVAAALLIVVPNINAEDFDSQTTIGRILSEEGRPTDQGRVELLDVGLSYLGSSEALFGGAVFDKSPHNAYLEVWARGGVVALLGLILVFARPLLVAVQSGLSRDPLNLTGRLALSVLGFMAVVAFNNAIWFPYTWVVLSLFVTALTVTTSRGLLGGAYRS